VKDSDGNEVDLATMCHREPGWAANRIGHMTEQLAKAMEQRDEACSGAAATARENEMMLAEIERLSAELERPEEVRLRDVIEAMEGRYAHRGHPHERVEALLEDLDEWIARAGEAERQRDGWRKTAESQNAAWSKAWGEKSEWRARAEIAESELSAAFGLPSTIGPAPGEAARVVAALRADRDEWRAQHENLLAMYQAQVEQSAVLREVLRRCVAHLSEPPVAVDYEDPRHSDRLVEDARARDDYHAARMLVGLTGAMHAGHGGDWDDEAAERGMQRIRAAALGTEGA
jgi:hypothetical protein